jgi:hypothetical protein
MNRTKESTPAGFGMPIQKPLTGITVSRPDCEKAEKDPDRKEAIKKDNRQVRMT